MSYIWIAIDGPAGAGKSSIAKAAAHALSYIYVDTGALYRAIGLYISQKGIDTSSRSLVVPLLKEIIVELKFVNNEQRVFLNDKDVSTDIRLPEMSMHASNVSAIPEVREFLFDLQRNIAKTNNVIMDGRDIGTVVLPNAIVKIFLTASAEVRAKRRYDEFNKKGQFVDFDKLLSEINQRDYNDSNRAIAPLKQADDAILIDTSNENLDQAIEHILMVIKQNIKE